MKAIKVQYAVKANYVDTNMRNIRKVMRDLQELANPGIKYSAFILKDGKMFVHFDIYSDQSALDVVSNYLLSISSGTSSKLVDRNPLPEIMISTWWIHPTRFSNYF